MSTKPETRLTTRVNNKLPLEITAEKTHNPFRAGVADFYYDGPYGDGWCEYKYRPTQYRHYDFDEALKLLTSNQRRWLLTRMRNGRRVCIIIGFSDLQICIAHPTFVTERPYTAKETAQWIHETWLRSTSNFTTNSLIPSGI